VKYLRSFVFFFISALGTTQAPINALYAPRLKHLGEQTLNFVKKHPVLTGITAVAGLSVTAGFAWKRYKITSAKNKILLEYAKYRDASITSRIQHEQKIQSRATTMRQNTKEKFTDDEKSYIQEMGPWHVLQQREILKTTRNESVYEHKIKLIKQAKNRRTYGIKRTQHEQKILSLMKIQQQKKKELTDAEQQNQKLSFIAFHDITIPVTQDFIKQCKVFNAECAFGVEATLQDAFGVKAKLQDLIKEKQQVYQQFYSTVGWDITELVDSVVDTLKESTFPYLNARSIHKAIWAVIDDMNHNAISTSDPKTLFFGAQIADFLGYEPGMKLFNCALMNSIIKQQQPLQPLGEHNTYKGNGFIVTPGGGLLSCDNDHTLTLCTLGTDRCLKTFVGHIWKVYDIAWIPGKKQFLSGSYDTIKLWDLQTGQCLKTFVWHTDIVPRYALIPDTDLFFSHQDGTIKLWNLGPYSQLTFAQLQLCYKIFTGKQPHTLTKDTDDYAEFMELPEFIRDEAITQGKVHSRLTSV
jgi:hypothetical protein